MVRGFCSRHPRMEWWRPASTHSSFTILTHPLPQRKSPAARKGAGAQAKAGAVGGAAGGGEKPGLSEEEVEEIREAFNLFDTEGTGACFPCLPAWLPACLGAVLSVCLGVALPLSKYAWLTPPPPFPGAIDVKELKSAMQSLGFDAKNHTVFQMIADLDQGGEGAGSLDFDSFLDMMTAKMVSERRQTVGSRVSGIRAFISTSTTTAQAIHSSVRPSGRISGLSHT